MPNIFPSHRWARCSTSSCGSNVTVYSQTGFGETLSEVQVERRSWIFFHDEVHQRLGELIGRDVLLFLRLHEDAEVHCSGVMVRCIFACGAIRLELQAATFVVPNPRFQNPRVFLDIQADQEPVELSRTLSRYAADPKQSPLRGTWEMCENCFFQRPWHSHITRSGDSNRPCGMCRHGLRMGNGLIRSPRKVSTIRSG